MDTERINFPFTLIQYRRFCVIWKLCFILDSLEGETGLEGYLTSKLASSFSSLLNKVNFVFVRSNLSACPFIALSISFRTTFLRLCRSSILKLGRVSATIVQRSTIVSSYRRTHILNRRRFHSPKFASFEDRVSSASECILSDIIYYANLEEQISNHYLNSDLKFSRIFSLSSIVTFIVIVDQNRSRE